MHLPACPPAHPPACLPACLCSSLQVRAAQKDLDFMWEVESDVPQELVGDPSRLQQIVINLGEQ